MLIVFACSGFCLLGCSRAAQPLDERALESSPIQLMEKLPAEGSLSAADFEIESGALEYMLVEGGQGNAKPLKVNRSKTDSFGATLAVAEGESRTQYLNRDEDGNIVMTAAIDHDENALTIFEPPMVLLYKELAAGESRTSESAMRVLDAKDHSKQRESGKAKRITKYAADQRIRTPAGDLRAKRLESKFIADLSLAKVTEQNLTFVVPDRGVVAEITVEDQKILGAFGKKRRRTLVLADLAEK